MRGLTCFFSSWFYSGS